MGIINWFSFLDATGYDLAFPLPGSCIDDCSAPGQDASEAVQYWIRFLKFEAPADAAREYLKGLGAWYDDELSDHGANLERLLWSICNDERERYLSEAE